MSSNLSILPSHHNQFKSKDYWDNFFIERNQKTFEWYLIKFIFYFYFTTYLSSIYLFHIIIYMYRYGDFDVLKGLIKSNINQTEKILVNKILYTQK